jgi:replication-associated recombination protein RarA
MLSESYRPSTLEEIIGHDDAKTIIQRYLKDNTLQKSVLISGTPGIGKTTLVIAAARTCGYEPLEINASRSLRSHEDVQKLRDSCMAPISFTSILKYKTPRKTCVILDEVDGSDPHAQRKVLEWVKDPKRVVPILFTANEIPVIFKRATEYIEIHRCMPLNTKTIYDALKHHLNMSLPEFQIVVKECQFDVRRILHRVQYGISDKPRIVTMTGDSIIDLLKQEEMFYKSSPIALCLSSTET